MNYRDYILSDGKRTRKPWYSIAWKWTKLALYIFLIISMLWGCGQMMVPKYGTAQILDVSGQKVYKPGVFFEIILGYDNVGKEHFFHFENGQLYEYPYLAIRTWSDAFVKTSSPFYGCFVFPVAWILVNLIYGFGGLDNGAGIIGALFLTSLIVRLITLMFSWKAQRNQDKMQLMQIKQAEIQAKYKGSKDPAAKQKQQMEMMQLYRKEGVSPLSTIGSSFLSIPFLIAMYTVVRATRELKIATIGQISLIEKPWDMITSGNYVYLSLLFVYLPIQILSMILPTILNLRKTRVITKEQKKARKRQFIMQGVMIVVFFVVTISIASGVAIYWIFSAFIQILQTLGFHFLRVKKRSKKNKNKESFGQIIKHLFVRKQHLKTTNNIENVEITKTKQVKTNNADKISYNPVKSKPKKSKFSLHSKKKNKD
ncbi:membrane protein insertase YidC [Spiroplasma endosymbiont of Megaselia nigra]|uniref:membrane protein insertase YidC n=1 Tax=Spiroplasma endosymbiont of Megaselia nigra TaxID=2478537 RepID=UPI000F883149|nr:membrane protein insertase YidC [Spiroplasma endosymbiont of Megaselia nigra]RUO86483.1 membrane protein insertase YidC [Spiroplasma endosymbiont of Megaselia nigra]